MLNNCTVISNSNTGVYSIAPNTVHATNSIIYFNIGGNGGWWQHLLSLLHHPCHNRKLEIFLMLPNSSPTALTSPAPRRASGQE